MAETKSRLWIWIAVAVVGTLVVLGVLIAVAVGVVGVGRLGRARTDTARTDARTVATAALTYAMENHAGNCPTVQDLIEGGQLEADRGRDPWDHGFVIECDGDNITAISPGEDGRPGTADDISSTQ